MRLLVMGGTSFVGRTFVEAGWPGVAAVDRAAAVAYRTRHLGGGRHPRRRQCALASLTSLEFTHDVLTAVVYTEPTGGSDPRQAGA